MHPHRLVLCLICFFLSAHNSIFAQKRKPAGGRLAIVVEERLAALRETPQLDGRLVRRLSRGRLIAIRSARITSEGVTFFLVNVSVRTRGWIQREAVVSPSRAADDQRLLRLIQTSSGFDQISRARIFLDHFPRSLLRPGILLLLGDSAEKIADRLSNDAARKIGPGSGDAPVLTYYMNYTGLDRYNRQGVKFVFNQSTKRFHYDGAAWRELIRRYPKSPEASEARKRLSRDRI